MKIKISVCTSVGMKRKVNQDNFCVNGFINESSENHLEKTVRAGESECFLAVCDGMGGEKHGEVASLRASQALDEYMKDKTTLLDNFALHAQQFSTAANDAVCNAIQQMGGEKMGSTLAGLYISPVLQKAVAANVGDSKVYLVHENKLEKLSCDHNGAQRMVDMGVITPEEARTHKSKSELTQYLGIPTDELEIEPHISREVDIQKGDIFLLCSDGLTDMLTENEICDIICSHRTLGAVCRTLVETADKNGGADNTTVILAKVK